MFTGGDYMRLRASVTVENSFIIPVFFVISVILIIFTLDFHDNVVAQSAQIQMQLKLEQENRTEKNAQSYEQQVICDGMDYMNIRMIKSSKTKQEIKNMLERKKFIKSNVHQDFIRVVNVGLDLKGD